MYRFMHTPLTLLLLGLHLPKYKVCRFFLRRDANVDGAPHFFNSLPPDLRIPGKSLTECFELEAQGQMGYILKSWKSYQATLSSGYRRGFCSITNEASGLELCCRPHWLVFQEAFSQFHHENVGTLLTGSGRYLFQTSVRRGISSFRHTTDLRQNCVFHPCM